MSRQYPMTLRELLWTSPSPVLTPTSPMAGPVCASSTCPIPPLPPKSAPMIPQEMPLASPSPVPTPTSPMAGPVCASSTCPIPPLPPKSAPMIPQGGPGSSLSPVPTSTSPIDPVAWLSCASQGPRPHLTCSSFLCCTAADGLRRPGAGFSLLPWLRRRGGLPSSSSRRFGNRWEDERHRLFESCPS